MPANVTEERRRLLRLYGAEIIESPPEEGSNGAVRLALELAERDPSYFMPFQYANEANPLAHYEGTGAEIAAALDRVDVFVAGLGHRRDADGGGRPAPRGVPRDRDRGGRAAPGRRGHGPALARGRLRPSDPGRLEARPEAPRLEPGGRRRPPALLDREGIFGGVSSGAVVHAARKLAEELDEGVVVCVLADGGWKYLSADFWERGRRRGRHGAHRLVVVPAAVRAALARARRVREAERGLRSRRPPRRRRRALRPGPQRRGLAVPLRAGRRPRDVVPRGRGLRARGLPLAPVVPAAALADGRRERRPLGGPARTSSTPCARASSPRGASWTARSSALPLADA